MLLMPRVSYTLLFLLALSQEEQHSLVPPLLRDAATAETTLQPPNGLLDNRVQRLPAALDSIQVADVEEAVYSSSSVQ
jgi:hypothetical protein